MSRLSTLILGGTTEASDLARRIAGDDRFDAVLSLAGVTKSPRAAAIPMRVGGFGGADGLRRHLDTHGTETLIDATHPFAAQMSRNAEAAAQSSGVPRLAIVRPAWRERAGDRWQRVPTMEDAAEALGADAMHVFLTIGRKDLAPFHNAAPHRYLVRSVDPPPADSLPPRTEVISARGPFDEDDEIRLLRDHDIDVLVTKNSGGGAAAAKLDAARKLGVRVIMIDRPPQPAGTVVEDAGAAFDWLVERHHEAGSARRGV